MRILPLVFGILVTVSVMNVSGQATLVSSPATTDILKLARAGVGDDVLAGVIQNQKAPFRLSADDILALKDANVTPATIKAMLTHDVALTPAAPQPVPQPAPIPPPAPAPVYLDPDPTPPVVVVPAYPYYPWRYHRPYYTHRGMFIWHW